MKLGKSFSVMDILSIGAGDAYASKNYDSDSDSDVNNAGTSARPATPSESRSTIYT